MLANFAFAAALILQTGVVGEQVFGGATYQAFAYRTDRACPFMHARDYKAGDLSWEEETFYTALSAKDQARERLAIPRASDGGPKQCAGRDGLSCPAMANLKAINKAGLMGRFSDFACTHKVPN